MIHVSQLHIPPATVLTKKDQKVVAQTTTAERDQNLTMVCFFSANGNHVPPVFAFPRVDFQPRMLKDRPWVLFILAHPSGWMTSDTFLETMKHFLKHTRSSKETKILPLLDDRHQNSQLQ